MKASKFFLPIIMFALLGLAWFSNIKAFVDTQSDYRACVKQAEQSIEEGLYEQAVEFYKESYKVSPSENVYVNIKEAYDKLYEEEHTDFIRNLYITDMEEAVAKYPKNSMFWEVQVDLYCEVENYSKAYDAVIKARNYGAKSDKLDEQYFKLLYMVDVDYKMYYDYKAALNGYISVYDGGSWFVMDETGEELTSNYEFVGLINNEGNGLFVNNIDARILDSKEITRARFDFEVEDAGFYDEETDYIPVKTEGKWRYVNSKGEFLSGKYEIAGSFYKKQAVAFDGENWVLLNEKGDEEKLDDFKDIKLDLYGCHNQNGIVIAKEDGKYCLYDVDFKRIGDFEADDIDICVDGKTMAFKDGKKWGFVDTKGEVVVDPQYKNAKSYSNGFAAVCNDDGKWGFINSKYELVIDYTYLDAFYFTAKDTCLVTLTEGSVQLLSFMFE